MSVTTGARAKLAYNEEHGITPKSVQRAVQESLHVILKAREVEQGIVNESPADFDLNELIRELERDMASAAASLEYERAALLRDQIAELKSGSGIAKVEPRRVPTQVSERKERPQTIGRLMVSAKTRASESTSLPAPTRLPSGRRPWSSQKSWRRMQTCSASR